MPPAPARLTARSRPSSSIAAMLARALAPDGTMVWALAGKSVAPQSAFERDLGFETRERVVDGKRRNRRLDEHQRTRTRD
jgi:adenylylsulfate kinase-like enzyme